MEKTNEWHTHLGKEFLDAAIGRRGDIGAHEILYKISHVHILNKKKNDDHSKEVADVPNTMDFLLRGTEGMVTPL